MGFPAWSRRVSPATSVGRMVSVDKQIAVKCGGVLVRPGDYVIGDADGVVVVPAEAAEKVVALLRQYDDKESKMIPIIQREKSTAEGASKSTTDIVVRTGFCAIAAGLDL